jgi:hypothetical protein
MLTDAPPRKEGHLAQFLESDRIRAIDLPQNGHLLTIAKSICRTPAAVVGGG